MTGSDLKRFSRLLGVAFVAFRLACLAWLSVVAPATVQGQPDSPWETLSFCTERISVGQGNVQGDGVSQVVSFSDDGRLVTFASTASNLVPGDTNGNWDIFLTDRGTGAVRQISHSPQASEDGRLGAGDCFLSGNGRYLSYVARAARASATGPFLCTNDGRIRGVECMLVFDLATGALEVVDVRPDGLPGDSYTRWGALSASGDEAAFWTLSAGLVPADTDARADVFVRDRARGVTELASVSSAGVKSNADSGRSGRWGNGVSISRDGRYVAFTSAADNLAPDHAPGGTDVYLRDRLSSRIELVSAGAGGGPGNGDSEIGGRQNISDDGRNVAFVSRATNLTPGGTNGRWHAYVRDRSAGTTELVSVSSGGAAGDSDSTVAAISGDGRYVVFSSRATNLVPSDTNGAVDVFVRDRVAGRTVRASVTTAGTEANRDAVTQTWQGLAVSADGLTVGWQSAATNLVPQDTNGEPDIFLRGPCQLTPTPPGETPQPTPTPTLLPTPTPTSTDEGPGPGLTPSPTPRRPGPAAECVCPDVLRQVPRVVIHHALANPERYYGWRYLLDPGKPPGPANPLRECLSLRSNSSPYHPLFNSVAWRVGCP